ncbi:DUF2271 domain-containing protein [Alteraurantiacibacter aquimixticola]|uniref:DUF2271 domain-containing protein n=1 Tax=Alteraurantiacibacter aquimixticola TaxID=2489173 RepID=A0A4T3F3E6_9SPHN|nr:DUF2271 domain-containing protein [Alteraurantiacibacter aquimixticola]TIX51688.1 DUF2271 domain-containing protein [Alteraurantiacibacter aquimixticola]
MRPSHYLALAAIGLPAPALANSGSVSIEIPRMSVNTYRKPYVAVWIENEGGQQVKMVTVLHDQARIGARWLPDLRMWWRKGGRAMDMPSDGISGPTRAPGRHTIPLRGLEGLAAGNYSVVVEAVRENGGRELVKVPFSLTPGRAANASASGSRELGAVSVTVRP